MDDLELMEFEGTEATGEAPRLRKDWPGVAAETEGPLDEVDEMELASDLLEVSDEAALDRVVANLLKTGARGLDLAGIPTAAVNALGGVVKQAIKKAIPALASDSAPSATITAHDLPLRRAATNAGAMFGLELEGLSPEDKEFEVAKRLARFGVSAARQLGRIGRRLTPRDAARQAAVAAARAHAPGLLRTSTSPKQSLPGSAAPDRPASENGKWVRCGRNIIIINCR
ncbi:MAG: hypothetical protein U1E42_16375 [Rhodospirillales bacterium]